MNKLLNVIQDSNGQISSTRIGKLIVIFTWAYNVIMSIHDPAVAAPSITLTGAMLGVIGLGTAHKLAENKAK